MNTSRELEPLGPATALVVVDMQRLFADATEWQVKSIPSILAGVLRLIEHRPQAALFTRFVTPHSPEEARGRWRSYYRRWRSVTGERMAAEMLELVAALQDYARPETTFDKTTYSSLADGALGVELHRRGIDTVVLCGAETDVCVLATALDAVDRGFRVVVAKDAVTSSSEEAHHALVGTVLQRLEEQLDLATVDQIIAAWPAR